jgi:hypothetical protein
MAVDILRKIGCMVCDVSALIEHPKTLAIEVPKGQ